MTSFLSNWRNHKQPRRIEYEILELEDKLTGCTLDFNVYNDCDLPFLNPRNEGTSLIRSNIVHAEVDDDCQTDDEQKEDAKTMLRNDVKSAINKFLQDKKDGTVECTIKNYNLQKRYSRVPFHLPCTE
jgi:hypothetical protein